VAITGVLVAGLWRLSTLDSSGAKALVDTVRPVVGREMASVLRAVLLDSAWEAGLVRKALVVALALLGASRVLRYAFFLLSCRPCSFRETPLLSLFALCCPGTVDAPEDDEEEEEEVKGAAGGGGGEKKDGADAEQRAQRRQRWADALWR
jgi:hypothetical protein